MAKLNQILAIVASRKAKAQSAITAVYHKLQKSALLDGISRVYRPRDEEGEVLPAESKRVQVRVSDALKIVQEELSDLFDIVATQDYANCRATADVVVDGEVILKAVPVTYLLFLEKQLTDLHTLLAALPILDPGEEWKYSDEADCYVTNGYESTRTKKVPRNHIKAEATDRHPAQVEVYHEDIIVGYWKTLKFSGATTEQHRNKLLGRVRALQEAVKSAREEGNSYTVTDIETGNAVMSFIFG